MELDLLLLVVVELDLLLVLIFIFFRGVLGDLLDVILILDLGFIQLLEFLELLGFILPFQYPLSSSRKAPRSAAAAKKPGALTMIRSTVNLPALISWRTCATVAPVPLRRLFSLKPSPSP